MKTMRKVISAVLVLSIALTCILALTGCGKNSPEGAAEGFIKAIVKADAKKAISYFPSKLVDYTIEEEYDGDKDEFYDEFEEIMGYLNDTYEESGVDAKDIKVKATDVEDIDDDELEDINEMLEDADLEAKDGKSVTVELSYEVDGEEETSDMEFTVIKVGSKWCVYGF